MMSNLKFTVLCLCYLGITLWYTDAQDALAFEESIEDDEKLPTDNRKPVENKEKCDTDELYYPGDNNDDWICDCRPAYLYYPDKNKCYPAYQKGPCRNNEYLILPNNSFVPICAKNRCRNSGQVWLNNGCIQLGRTCTKDTRRRYGVDERTLEVQCLPPPQEQLNVMNRFSDTKEEYCFKGCKRYFNKTCPGQTV